jgi:hypothetical protein
MKEGSATAVNISGKTYVETISGVLTTESFRRKR